MLSVFTLRESNQWDELVKKFKKFDVYYLSDYVRAFNFHGDGDPLLFYYKDENIKAMNVVMKRDIGKFPPMVGRLDENTHYDLATPYGYGGFVVEGNINSISLNNLNDLYIEYCKEENIVSEIVRFHPIIKNHEGLEIIYDIENIGKTVSIDLKSKDYIWENFTSKNRNVIRKAIKSGVKIFWGRDDRLVNKFIDMYNLTMDKQSANDYYYFKQDFYNSILNDLKYNCIFFYAELEEEIIAMAMVLYVNKQLHYHLSASKKEYLSFAPTNLLLYEVARWGSENGYTTLHLGGGVGSKTDSLYKFKKAFNKRDDNSYYIGKKVFKTETYNKLLDLRISDGNTSPNSNYFPLYRG